MTEREYEMTRQDEPRGDEDNSREWVTVEGIQTAIETAEINKAAERILDLPLSTTKRDPIYVEIHSIWDEDQD